MMEQNVQTFITWTHGVRPTWLQYHGPSLHHCELGVPGEIHLLRRRRSSTLSLCLQYELPPHHFPEVNPARLPHPPTAEGNQRAALAIDHQHRARGLSSTRQSKCTRKRDRTVKSVTSSVAERYSRRPFTVFTPKRSTRATRSRTTRCKHYCHALPHSGRKCLSPCVRRQRDIFIADVHVIRGSSRKTRNNLSENIV